VEAQRRLEESRAFRSPIAGTLTLLSWLFLTGLIILLAPPTLPAQVDPQGLAKLDIDPALCDLGLLSPEDPLDSEMTPGKTTVRLLSSGDWRIEIVLAGPIRRLNDGLELPPPDPSEVIAPIPGELFSLLPSTVASGEGSNEWQELEVDWREVATALEHGLDVNSMSGVYGSSLIARLVDPEGQSLTAGIHVTVQFEVSRWVRVSEGIADIDLSFAAGDWDVINETASTSLLVGGNVSWRLSSARVGEMSNEEGLTDLPVPGIAVYVPGEELAPGLEPAVAGYVTLGEEPVTIVLANPESPSSGSLEDIPIVVRLEADEPLPAGRYRMTLVFEASAAQPLP